MRDDLKLRWEQLVVGLDAAGDASDLVFADLIRRHAEPHRRYHSAEHLTEIHAALDVLGADSAPVRLAAWFHDAIYDPTRHDNEAQSAELACEALTSMGVGDGPEVARLVELTASHEPPPDDDGAAALCDADLSILAAPPERYVRYRRQVRAEYTHVDDDAWQAGRTTVLEGFLAREHLFHTAKGRLTWQAKARANIAAELHLLNE